MVPAEPDRCGVSFSCSLFAGFSTWQWLRAEGLRHRAERDACGGEIDRALALCSQGGVGRGLLGLGRDAPERPVKAPTIWSRPSALTSWPGRRSHPAQGRAPARRPGVRRRLQPRWKDDRDGQLKESPRWPPGTAHRRDGTGWDRERASRGRPLPWSVGSRCVFSPDGRLLGYCAADWTARLWRVADGTTLGEPRRHEGPVLCISFSPDGRTLLTGSTDGTAHSGMRRAAIHLGEPLKHSNPVTQVGFRPDGRVALTGCLDGRVRLWDARTRKLISDQPQIAGVRRIVVRFESLRSVVTGPVSSPIRCSAQHSRMVPNSGTGRRANRLGEAACTMIGPYTRWR